MSAVLAVTRRLEFPGKRRLRQRVTLPDRGLHEVGLAGARFRLDLRESLHRDYYFGLCDQLELRLIAGLLADGGDLVDVGAHIGMYSVTTATRIRGRVLAIEPNPVARGLLEDNVALNGCENLVVEPVAASSSLGYSELHVPEAGDSSWSTLVPGRLDDDSLVEVETSTLDIEVARHRLDPGVVKIDAEGSEVDVLLGARDVLARRPALFVELAGDDAEAVTSVLRRLGYLVARAGTRRLERWRPTSRPANAVFLQPRHLGLLMRRDRRAFAGGEQDVVRELRPLRGEPVDEAGEEAWTLGQGRDWAEPLSRDAHDVEAALLHELA